MSSIISITITSKIVNGKEAPDVFLSMGDLEVDQVEKADMLLEGTRTRYAENSLCILVPTADPGGVATVADFTRPSVKVITLPDPALNSVGVYAKECLENAGIWDQVDEKVLYARFAADSKTATATGQAEASIGYYPCAREVHVKGEEPAIAKNIRLVGQVPPDLYEPFWCEGGVAKGAKNPEGGKKLLAFLTTPEAQEIYKRWAFVHDVSEAPEL